MAVNAVNGTTSITYRRIPIDKSYDVSQLLLNSFFKEEPLGLLLGLSLDQVSRWIPKYVESAIEQNLSIMAVAMTPARSSTSEDEDDPQLTPCEEQIVGVSVNISESLCILNFLDKDLEPNMWNVGQYLRLLDESVKDHPGAILKTIHCLFLNVLTDFAGRGIAKTLAQRSEELARESGFDCLEVETTSEFSYRVYSNLGYTKIAEFPFEEFKDEKNEPFIKNNNGIHKYGRVMWKRLSSSESSI